MSENLKTILEESKKDAYMYVEFPHKKYWNNNLKNESSINDYFGESLLNSKDKNYLYYIHIPHCHTQCLYCTCHVEITKDYNVVKKYFDYLLKEIDIQIDIFKKYNIKPKITDLHYGGGSPTFLKKDEFDKLNDKLKNFVDFENLNECAIEIDPRRIREDMMHFYHSRGINRISFGVQEFDKEVQKMIARLQPEFLLERLLTKEIREKFKNGINFDLICGLPGQNLKNFEETIKKTIEFSPDRICLNYLHVSPKFHPHQLKMPKDKLPDEVQRKELFQLAVENLLSNNYIRAGYDHFVKNNDSLAEEIKKNQASWNRLGIVTGSYTNTIGAGVSATCKIEGELYYQNCFENNTYEDLLDKNILPITKYHSLSKDDQIREKIIKDIRLFFKIDKEFINKEYNIEFDSYFKGEIDRLSIFFEEDLLENTNKDLKILEKGKVFSNLIASKFDNYLNKIN